MDRVKLLIVPSEKVTRLIARSVSGMTLLRAHLPPEPWRARALPQLLEGLGGFAALHAALVVPAKAPLSATRLYPDWFADGGTEAYDLQVIGSGRREVHAWWGR